ncbi:CHAT domain-containing protein [Streptomyces sp. NRRL B-24572]|uniref:CHAT domain-containing protein n=1 Tax=Streptomyces sp. NRRL B-24572 TaxID=1962156 RepID=UPI000A36AB6E|nr:CHAT domain-containing protein [Streptomyces sp. NRRL B-24572]
MSEPSDDSEAMVGAAVRGMWKAMELPASDPLCPALISYLIAFEEWGRRSELLDEHPELLGDKIDEVLDRLVTFCLSKEQLSEPHPGELSWTFACHRDLLRSLRAHGDHRERFAALDRPSVEPIDLEWAKEVWDAPAAMVARAGTLIMLRRHHEASSLLDRALAAARSNADHTAEGEAELMLCQLEESRGSAADPGSRARMLFRAERAEAAFRRAGNAEGMARALIHAVGCAIDVADEFTIRHLLDKLREVNDPWWQWWDAYAKAMNAWQSTGDVEGLMWCRDNAGVLGTYAQGQRDSCQRKIVFSQGQMLPADQLPLELKALPSHPGASGGADDAVAESMLATLLADIEAERLTTHSEARQRELSAKHRITYFTAAHRKEAQGDWEGAVDTLEGVTNRGLLYQASAAWRRQRTPERLRTETELWNSGFFDALSRYFEAPSAASANVLQYAMRSRRTRDLELEEQLASAFPRSMDTHRPASVAELISRLPQGHEVALYTANGSLMLINSEGVQRLARFDMDAVIPAAARLRDGLTDPTSRDPMRSDAALFLEQTLVKPLRDAADGSHLSVVPNMSLWTLPIGVIGRQPLCDNKNLGYVPNLSVLTTILGHERLQRRIERFVGIADPDGSLRHAREEVLCAAQYFSDQTTLFGDEIALRSALANLEDADVAHIACHGMTFPDFPEYSALRLASGTPRKRFLLAQDAGGLRLNARLFVLAACHSGSTLSAGAEDYIGFPGVFLMAGARCVAAPLWAVDDASTAAMMAAFYNGLANGLTPACALRAAQRELAAQTGTSHPCHWAAFQIFGVSP